MHYRLLELLPRMNPKVGQAPEKNEGSTLPKVAMGRNLQNKLMHRRLRPRGHRVARSENIVNDLEIRRRKYLLQKMDTRRHQGFPQGERGQWDPPC